VYAKLVAVMVALGFFIPLLVAGFFLLSVGRGLGAALERLMADHSELLAASTPDVETARRAAARLDVGIRFEGPSGRWSTDGTVPGLGAAALSQGAAPGRRSCGPACYVVTRSDGGSYLFQWRLHQRARAAHDRLLLLLLGLLVAVVVAAYALLRRILRPLGWLRAAVARVGEGHLDVEVGRRTSDEFGELADAFDRMVGRVREMVRSRDRLLLDVSHELRSPLTRMKVALALGADDARRRCLESNVAEMEAMVTELLELERLRDQRGLRLQECDLVSIVQDAARAFEDRPPGAVFGARPAELRLRIDPDKVRRVLGNVLENASKYSLPDSGPVRISIDEGTASAVVHVEDDGPGIPEKDLERLFEPFFRVDPSRSRRTGGYGLGLSLCKRIMEAHGGGIVAANRPGRGASFRITFSRP
jgi:signal transduction histidine kinase